VPLLTRGPRRACRLPWLEYGGSVARAHARFYPCGRSTARCDRIYWTGGRARSPRVRRRLPSAAHPFSLKCAATDACGLLPWLPHARAGFLALPLVQAFGQAELQRAAQAATNPGASPALGPDPAELLRTYAT
jgi:hypothetical protein